jgi:hypothetical protein
MTRGSPHNIHSQRSYASLNSPGKWVLVEPFAPEGQRFEKGHPNPWLDRPPAWQAIAMLCKLSEKLFPVGAFLSRGS